MSEHRDSECSARIVAGLETLFAVPQPDITFVTQLEKRLAAQSMAYSRPREYPVHSLWRLWGSLARPRRWIAAAISLWLMLSVTVIAIGPRQVWAFFQQILTHYLPGFGFVDMGQAYMLAEPVEVQRESVLLRIEQIIATSDRTLVAIDGINLEGWRRHEDIMTRWESYREFKAFLRLSDGRELESVVHALNPGGGYMVFPPLPAGASTGQVTLVIPRLPLIPPGTAPENWSIPLTLHPVTETATEALADRTQVYSLSDASDTYQGITLHVLDVAHTPMETAVHVQVDSTKYGCLWVSPKLRDSQHRITYPPNLSRWGFLDLEIEDSRVFLPTIPPPDSVCEDVWVFTPLHATPQTLTLEVDHLDIFTPTAGVNFTVDFGAHPQAGDRWPLEMDFVVEGFPIHIAGVRLEKVPDDRLWITMEEFKWELIFEITLPESHGDAPALKDVFLDLPDLSPMLIQDGMCVRLKEPPQGTVRIGVLGINVQIPWSWSVTWEVPGTGK